MGLEFTPDAQKRGIPPFEATYAMLNGEAYDNWEPIRPPHGSTRLWIGPSRFGTLEIIAEIAPPNSVKVFHVMPLRASTAAKVAYKKESEK